MSSENTYVYSISCPICFNESLNKSSSPSLMVLTSCGHTFCDPCLRALVTNRNNKIPCPTCRKPFNSRQRNYKVRIFGEVHNVNVGRTSGSNQTRTGKIGRTSSQDIIDLTN